MITKVHTISVCLQDGCNLNYTYNQVSGNLDEQKGLIIENRQTANDKIFTC